MKKVLVLLGLTLCLNSCYVVRALIWNVADINDYKKFAYRSIPKSSNPFHFTEVQSESSFQINFTTGFYKTTKTVAFLIIRNDSLIYEHYSPGRGPGSIVPSFSVAKSFVSALTGIAIDEGYIKSMKDPITNYLTELDTGEYGKITVVDLVDMRSGIRCNETYINPFGKVTQFY